MKAPTILVISHVVPYPPTAGNETRILRMLGWLRRQGYRLVLLLNHEPLPPARLRDLAGLVDQLHFIGDDYGVPFPPPAKTTGWGRRLQRRLSVSLPDSGIYRALFGMDKRRRLQSDAVKQSLGSERLIQVSRHLCQRYEPFAVIAEYIFAAPCFDGIPNDTLRIIDTHDMFSRKADQVLSHGIDDPLPCTLREERSYLLKADLVIAIQAHEAKLFRRLVPEREVITVGIDYDIAPAIDDRAVRPGAVLLVGSDNAKNRHGLREFLTHAWPIIRSADSRAVLRVVGKLADHVEPADADGVQRIGWVLDLDAEYRTAAVVINPNLAGTGLKIKSVEALCRGKALVATPTSVEGIDLAVGCPYRVCGDWRTFADAVVGLLASADERRGLERCAHEFARAHFSSPVVYEPLAQRLQQRAGAQAASAARVN